MKCNQNVAYLVALVLSLLLALTQAELQIIQPSKLADHYNNTTISGGSIPAKMGNFGVYQKDTSILARVIIPQSNKNGC